MFHVNSRCFWFYATWQKLWPYLVTGNHLCVPAESVYNQEVPNNPCDADSKDDGADGVVGMVRNINSPKWEWGLRRHRHLQMWCSCWFIHKRNKNLSKSYKIMISNMKYQITKKTLELYTRETAFCAKIQCPE